MFDKIKVALSKAKDAFCRLAGIVKDTEQQAAALSERFTVRPLARVRVRIPRSSMTRKGPGITKAVRRALASLTVAERLVCRAKGWDRGMVREDGRL
jgi:hypothetical protein